MDKPRSAWKLLHIKVGISPFLLINLYLIFALPQSCHFRNIGVESNDGSHSDSLDALGPGGRILNKMCTHSLTAKQ